ncbi:MAG: nitrophenyl compound nitroreductase subunit ArsF family protein [Candidatus Krumholzibacteriia bacterium]
MHMKRPSFRPAAPASVLLLAVTCLAPLAIGASEDSAGGGTAAANALPEPSLVLYYFHGTTRCTGCLTIEDLAERTAADEFQDLMLEGQLAWRAVDVDEPGNERFMTEYDLAGQALILVDNREQPPRWRSLDEIWNLWDDPERFRAYLVREIAAWLGDLAADG